MKVAIFDDHVLIREGFVSIISNYEGIEQVFQGESLEDLKNLLRENSDIELVLVDLQMKETTTLDLVPMVRRLSPKTRVAILSMNEDPKVIASFLSHGVNGYIPKSLSHSDLLDALGQILSGETYVPGGMITSLHRREHTILTPRQAQILGLLAQGASNKTIAHKLSLSESTVKTHVSAILLALKADNRLMAVQIAQTRGLITGILPLYAGT